LTFRKAQNKYKNQKDNGKIGVGGGDERKYKCISCIGKKSKSFYFTLGFI